MEWEPGNFRHGYQWIGLLSAEDNTIINLVISGMSQCVHRLDSGVQHD